MLTSTQGSSHLLTTIVQLGAGGGSSNGRGPLRAALISRQRRRGHSPPTPLWVCKALSQSEASVGAGRSLIGWRAVWDAGMHIVPTAALLRPLTPHTDCGGVRCWLLVWDVLWDGGGSEREDCPTDGIFRCRLMGVVIWGQVGVEC